MEKTAAKPLNANAFLVEIISKVGPFIALIFLCLFLALTSPMFVTMQNIMNILRQAAINAIVTIGMLLVLLTAGIDLSVGSILATALCVVAVIFRNFPETNPALLILLMLLIGTALGALNGFILVKMRLPTPFVSTLGTQNMARAIALIVTGALPISGFPRSLQYLGSESVLGFPVSFILVIGIYALVFVLLNFTALGRHIYAVGGNQEAARLSGINVSNVLMFVYTICGFFSALAGLVLLGRVNTAFPLAGLGYELDAIASCVIGGTSFNGGKGTIGGTMIGVLLTSVLRNGLNLLGASSEFQMFAIGLVIILAVYIDVLRSDAEKKVQIQLVSDKWNEQNK